MCYNININLSNFLLYIIEQIVYVKGDYIMNFKVGDVVKCIDINSNVEYGDIGIVIDVGCNISVVWDKFNSGHDFKDTYLGFPVTEIADKRFVCPKGHGWTMSREQIVCADLTDIEFNEVMHSLISKGFYHPSIPACHKTKEEKLFNVDFVVPVYNKVYTETKAECVKELAEKSEKIFKKNYTIERLISNHKEETMRNTFTFVEGERTAIVVDTIEHKNKRNETIREKKVKEIKIPTITTIAQTINGTASTTCDKEDFNERTGCLVAAAKVISLKTEETSIMYEIAIKSWGESICMTILETLANRAVGVSGFDKIYKKWKKATTEHDKKQRTCSKCHKIFDTPDEARECEKAHEQRKIDKLNKYLEHKKILKEARLRLEKEERENKIQSAMDKLSNDIKNDEK